MHEKRRHTRVIIESLSIKCTMHFATEVQLLNISPNGACIVLNKQLEMGSRYTLHIKTPDNDISLKGAVIWERISGSQMKERGEIFPRYEVGIKFDNIFTDDGASLIDFIDNNVLPKQFKIRLQGLRVKIIEPDSAVVQDHKNCNVIRISEGGMLIETEKKLDLESRFEMELILPKYRRPLKFLGRVASSLAMTDKVPMRYGAGIEFIEMSEKDGTRLRKFIDSLQVF
jgi:c-di-GMP-binding flagellar brake protein YcgR